MPTKQIAVNRAPVLTLWAAVVAERLGHKRDEALTLAKAVAGLTASSKAKRLGIHQSRDSGEKPAPKKKHSGNERVELLGWSIAVEKTPKGLRAIKDYKPIAPESVVAYLNKAFGDDLDDVRAEMVRLAAKHTPADLAEHAFELYARFRPVVAAGARGWGQMGTLDLALIRAMAK